MSRLNKWAVILPLIAAPAATGHDHVFVGSWSEDAIYRYDTKSGELLAVTPVQGNSLRYNARGIGLGDHGILFVSAPGFNYRINGRTGEVLSAGPGRLFYDWLPQSGDAVFAARYGSIHVFDQNSLEPISAFTTGGGDSMGLAAAPDRPNAGFVSFVHGNRINRWGEDRGSVSVIPMNLGENDYSIIGRGDLVNYHGYSLDLHFGPETIGLVFPISTFDLNTQINMRFGYSGPETSVDLLINDVLVHSVNVGTIPYTSDHNISLLLTDPEFSGLNEADFTLRINEPSQSGRLQIFRQSVWTPDGSISGVVTLTSPVVPLITNRPESPDANERSGLNKTLGIELGPDGLLYVASENNHQILRYDPLTGAFVDVFVGPDLNDPDASPDWLLNPQFMSFASDGSLFVTSDVANTIYHVAPDGTLIKTFGSHDKPAFIQLIPREIGVDNGTFQAGRLDPWHVAAGEPRIVEDPGRPGEFIVELLSNSEVGIATLVETLSQSFYLSFMYQVPEAACGVLEIFVSEELVGLVDLAGLSSGVWYEDHLRIEDPALLGLGAAELLFMMRDAPLGTRLWLEDVAITSAFIPEPASFALMMLGGLCLTFRRSGC